MQHGTFFICFREDIESALRNTEAKEVLDQFIKTIHFRIREVSRTIIDDLREIIVDVLDYIDSQNPRIYVSALRRLLHVE